jgi:Caspase domain
MSNQPLAGIYPERIAMKLVVINRLLIKSLGLLFAVGTLLPTVAQAPSDIRIALVIGNAAYPGSAALANPGNDAKAMGETLRSLGFTVVEARDSSRAQMMQAISTVRDNLKGRAGTGMFYYAGHALQLDWRNYMVPVDAKMSKAADVPEQTVDLSQVIDAFKAAGNKMNIVVLDACRDNPFAGTATGKGLAQLDAPPGTFLAYATAPGNVAEDGEAKADSNGLYTKYLLQELKKPQAKIEDVFKRVRLNVRQQSQGRQIPWESTSLEDDFFFNAGLKPTQKLSESEKDRAFTTEKADWDKIKDSKNVDDFYAFLQKYPNGNISEHAQAAIERLAKAKTVAVADKNGITQAVAFERYRLGDYSRHVYKDAQTGIEIRRTFSRITKIEGDRIEYNNGQTIKTSAGGTIRNTFIANLDPPRMDLPAGEYVVGKKWSSRSIQTLLDSNKIWREDDIKIVAFEDVTVPAGTFKAYKFELNGIDQSGTRIKLTYWAQPEWGDHIKSIREIRPRIGARIFESFELLERGRGG